MGTVPTPRAALGPRRARRTAALALLALGTTLAVLAPGSAGAQTDGTGTSDGAGFVTVVEVSGLLDPILVDFVGTSLADAEDGGARALVLQLNSRGAVVGDDRLADLARRIDDSDLTVAVWVGPSGAAALGGAAQLASVADVVGVSPGSRIGELGDDVLPPDLGPPFGDVAPLLRDEAVGAERALELGVAAEPSPTIGDFLVTLPGFESQEVTQGDEVRLEPLTVARFAQLPLASQLMHTVASPAVAYLLLAIGLGLIVFELYTAGIGIAGVVGAGSLILGSYGLWVLPTRPVGIALLVLSFAAFAVDVQTGVPRLWTVVGAVLFAAGTFALYDGVSLPWITVVAAFVGVALTFLAGMPAMVRTRFSTPTIGREWMVGELGVARGAVAPEGVVVVQGAPWRARTHRATPLADGQAVRVVALEGLVLEVEPLEGAARDHRERPEER